MITEWESNSASVKRESRDLAGFFSDRGALFHPRTAFKVEGVGGGKSRILDGSF